MISGSVSRSILDDTLPEGGGGARSPITRRLIGVIGWRINCEFGGSMSTSAQPGSNSVWRINSGLGFMPPTHVE